MLERLASVGMLAAGVGHEINNPLASILAAVESLSRMLDRGGDLVTLRAEALETLQMIEQDVLRCRETTHKLMLLAQPYTGAFAWVDVNRAVRDTFTLLRHQMNQQGITWREALDPALPEVWARDSGIRGICMNLMINAVQAMPEGGELVVTTAAHDGAIELAVEDTGPGIPPEQLGRIWEPFFTTKPAGQGTGLGLFVTQSVLARYGGTIQAGNREPHGARFVVRLPVSAERTS
jgi:two-component system NtrC family sensor kinase